MAYSAQSDVMYEGDSLPPPIGKEQAGNVVNIGLIEYEINMPDTLPAGLTDFSIHNRGDVRHSLAMKRRSA
jgi:hypothetical protein